MKRNKLYIANKGNKSSFAHKFEGGGQVLPFDVQDFQGLGFSGPTVPDIIPGLDPANMEPLPLTPQSPTKPKLGKMLMDNVGSLGSAVGGIAGNLIRGNFDDGGIGSGIQNVGGAIGSAIPGPIGGIVSAGSGLIGGLFSRAFGVSENKENTNFIKSNTQNAFNVGNALAASSTTGDLINNSGKMASNSGFKWSDLYHNGWFTSRGTRLGNNLIAREKSALATQSHGLSTGAKNVDYNMDRNIMRNFAAFGGPLEFGLMPIGGAIDYELAQRRLAQKDLEAKKALGGPLHTHGADWTNGVTIIDNGGTHEQNPFEGVPMGIAPDGQPNLVEEGEVIFNDYVFSNRLRVPKAVREKYKLRGQKEMTFADAAKKAQKESEERPNDPISQRGLEDIMYKLMIEQEAVREGRQQRKYSEGGEIHIAPSKKGTFTAAASKHGMGVQEFASKVLANPEDYSPAMRKKANFARNASKWKHAFGGPMGLSNLRYMPAIGSSIMGITDAFGLTNSPDYTNPNSILEAGREGARNIKDVAFTPIEDYLTYRPFDTMFYGNQLTAQAEATRRAISNGNRMTATAGLLAADYNAQTQLGNLFRQAEEYNLAQRERVGNFNRATNQFNAEGFLKAAMANADNSRQRARIILDSAEKAAAMRDNVDARVGAARSANLTNLFDSLGNIGREAFAMDMIKNNPSLLYDWMGRYKGKLPNDATGESRGKAKGGYLTIKRRG